MLTQRSASSVPSIVEWRNKNKQGKFLAGRKRKEEEENYIEMLENIIREMHGPKFCDSEELNEDSFDSNRKMNELSLMNPSNMPTEDASERLKYGIKPVKEADPNLWNTENSEKEEVDADSNNLFKNNVDFHFQEPDNYMRSPFEWNPVDFSYDNLALPGFEESWRPLWFDGLIDIHFSNE